MAKPDAPPRFRLVRRFFAFFPHPWLGVAVIAAFLCCVSYAVLRVVDYCAFVALVNRRGTVDQVVQRTRCQTRDVVERDLGPPERVAVEYDQGRREEAWVYECRDGRVALSLRRGAVMDATVVYTSMD